MILSTLLAAAAMARITDAGELLIRDNAVRLGDVVQLDVADRQRIGAIVIARAPTGARHVQVSRADLLLLARRAVPGLQVEEAAEGMITLRVEAAATEETRQCFEVAAPVAQDEFISAEDVNAVSCDRQQATAALRHDRETGAAVAARALAPGDYLGRIHLGQPAIVRRGDKLVLQSRSGPVVIERPVVAMQSGKASDRRIFVQTDDGTTIATDLSVEPGR